MKNIYTPNVTAGSLLIPESRKIADLMIRQVSADEWKNAIQRDNLLQRRSVSSSIRIANLIRSRLILMTPELWLMVRDRDVTLATQSCFAAAIKHCRILGDYLDFVVREQFKSLEDKLTPALWNEFITSCQQRDPGMAELPSTTATKMRTVVHRILKEVGYLQNAREWRLHKIDIVPELLDYLEAQKEAYVLKCIQVSI